MKLRLSEVYLSVQGEGPRVGRPTVFVRFAGCNLKCPLWPCDTPHAIDPKLYRQDSRLLEPAEVAERIVAVATPGSNICYTGGEPFLQNHQALMELNNLIWKDFKIQEVFTNGTLEFPDWALDNMYFVMDWKLPGSGDSSVGISQRWANFKELREGDAVKFTIASREDYEFARAIYMEESFKKRGAVDVYYGVVWGKVTNEELIGWVLADKLPWIHNMQVHNYIWDREKRGI